MIDSEIDRAPDPLPVVLDASAIPQQPGGAGTYVRELLRALPGSGVAANVMLRENDARPWNGAAHLHRIVPNGRAQRLVWEQTLASRDIVEAIRRSDLPLPAVIHSPHYTMPTLLGSRWKPSRVVTIHDLTFFSRPGDHDPVKRALFSSAIRRAARSSDALIAVSARTASELERYLHVRVPIHVIEHGIDHERFCRKNDDGSDDASLASIGITKDFIAHVGTIEPRKNIEGLLRAYHLLVTQKPNDDVPVLVLAGSEWAGMSARIRPLIAIAEAAHSRAQVICCGAVPNDIVPAIYRKAKVVAYPSWEEGFGLPALEALACGATVVSSQGSVMDELAGDAIVGVDPANPTSILHGLLTGLEDSLRGDRTLRGMDVASRFKWETSARLHADLYRSLA